MAVALERALAAALAMTVFAFASGSTIVNSILIRGRPARWDCLFVLGALAVAYATVARPRLRLNGFLLLTIVLVAVAFASAFWSVDPWLTTRRAGAFAAVVVAGIGLFYGSRGRAESIRLLLLGLLAGMVAVAVAGLVVLAVAHEDAIQAASYEYQARFRGFGQNPNTSAELLAIGVPLALLFVLEEGSRRARVGAAVVAVLFATSIAASGSRGPMIAALLGSLVLVLARRVAWPRRLALALLLAGAFLAAVVASQIPDPKTVPSSPTTVTRHVGRGVADADRPPPRYVTPAAPVRRTLFSSSGRMEAWRGAVHKAEQRPLAGYGFGTEQLAFVDRYVAFEADLPENSYIGAALQLGLVGLVLLLAIVAAALAGFVQKVRRLTSAARPVAAACAGAALSALFLGLTQSYLFSVGNIATTSAWLCMFLLVAVTSAARNLRI
jgi:O-antigen ligase